MVDANSVKLREKLVKDKEAREPATVKEATGGALGRFSKSRA